MENNKMMKDDVSSYFGFYSMVLITPRKGEYSSTWNWNKIYGEIFSFSFGLWLRNLLSRRLSEKFECHFRHGPTFLPFFRCSYFSFRYHSSFFRAAAPKGRRGDFCVFQSLSICFYDCPSPPMNSSYNWVENDGLWLNSEATEPIIHNLPHTKKGNSFREPSSFKPTTVNSVVT